MAQQTCVLCRDIKVITITAGELGLYRMGAKKKGFVVGPRISKPFCSKHMKQLTINKQ
jgi:hypothetical protein